MFYTMLHTCFFFLTIYRKIETFTVTFKLLNVASVKQIMLIPCRLKRLTKTTSVTCVGKALENLCLVRLFNYNIC